MPTPRVTRPPLSTSSVAISFAATAGAWYGSTTRFTKMRARSVSAAAAAFMTSISWLRNVIRSPAEMLENGPASIPLAQSMVVARV